MSKRSRATPWFRTVGDYGRRCAEHTEHLQRHDVWRWPDEKLVALAEHGARFDERDVAALATEVLKSRALSAALSAAEPSPARYVVWGSPLRYRSDDRDLEGHDKDLIVQQGGNGDWYLSIAGHGERIGPSVRLTTSGPPRGYEKVGVAVANLWRALAHGVGSRS